MLCDWLVLLFRQKDSSRGKSRKLLFCLSSKKGSQTLITPEEQSLGNFMGEENGACGSVDTVSPSWFSCLE